MFEPYASMMEELGIRRVVRRNGDLWPGAPGCSLTTRAELIDRDPDLVQRVVNAYVAASLFVNEKPDAAAEIAAPFIGVHVDVVRRALRVNRPNVNAIRNGTAIKQVLTLMQKLGYVQHLPQNFVELSFLDRAQRSIRSPLVSDSYDAAASAAADRTRLPRPSVINASKVNPADLYRLLLFGRRFLCQSS